MQTHTDVDATGGSYYGGTGLYLMQSTPKKKGEQAFECLVPLPKDGPVAAAAWEPTKGTSRRPVVWGRLHAIFMNRLRERRSWLVSFSNLRPFGPRRGRSGCQRDSGRVDGVFPRQRRRDAIVVIPRESTWSS